MTPSCTPSCSPSVSHSFSVAHHSSLVFQAYRSHSTAQQDWLPVFASQRPVSTLFSHQHTLASKSNTLKILSQICPAVTPGPAGVCWSNHPPLSDVGTVTSLYLCVSTDSLILMNTLHGRLGGCVCGSGQKAHRETTDSRDCKQSSDPL